MKLTAKDLYEFGVIDGIIKETDIFKSIDKQISSALKELDKLSADELKEDRYEKFRYFDEARVNASSVEEMEVV